MIKRLLARIFKAKSPSKTGGIPGFIPMRDENGSLTGLMDEATAEYLESDAPDPVQSDLDEALSRVERIRVFDAGMAGGSVMRNAWGRRPDPILDLTDAEAIGNMRGCFRINTDPKTFGHCMCFGGPTMELHDGICHRNDQSPSRLLDSLGQVEV